MEEAGRKERGREERGRREGRRGVRKQGESEEGSGLRPLMTRELRFSLCQPQPGLALGFALSRPNAKYQLNLNESTINQKHQGMESHRQLQQKA